MNKGLIKEKSKRSDYKLPGDFLQLVARDKLMHGKGVIYEDECSDVSDEVLNACHKRLYNEKREWIGTERHEVMTRKEFKARYGDDIYGKSPCTDMLEFEKRKYNKSIPVTNTSGVEQAMLNCMEEKLRRITFPAMYMSTGSNIKKDDAWIPGTIKKFNYKMQDKLVNKKKFMFNGEKIKELKKQIKAIRGIVFFSEYCQMSQKNSREYNNTTIVSERLNKIDAAIAEIHQHQFALADHMGVEFVRENSKVSGSRTGTITKNLFSCRKLKKVVIKKDGK